MRFKQTQVSVVGAAWISQLANTQEKRHLMKCFGSRSSLRREVPYVFTPAMKYRPALGFWITAILPPDSLRGLPCSLGGLCPTQRAGVCPMEPTPVGRTRTFALPSPGRRGNPSAGVPRFPVHGGRGTSGTTETRGGGDRPAGAPGASPGPRRSPRTKGTPGGGGGVFPPSEPTWSWLEQPYWMRGVKVVSCSSASACSSCPTRLGILVTL